MPRDSDNDDLVTRFRCFLKWTNVLGLCGDAGVQDLFVVQEVPRLQVGSEAEWFSGL